MSWFITKCWNRVPLKYVTSSMISSRCDARLFSILAKDISTELPTGGGSARVKSTFLRKLVKMVTWTNDLQQDRRLAWPR